MAKKKMTLKQEEEITEINDVQSSLPNGESLFDNLNLIRLADLYCKYGASAFKKSKSQTTAFLKELLRGFDREWISALNSAGSYGRSNDKLIKMNEFFSEPALYKERLSKNVDLLLSHLTDEDKESLEKDILYNLELNRYISREEKRILSAEERLFEAVLIRALQTTYYLDAYLTQRFLTLSYLYNYNEPERYAICREIAFETKKGNESAALLAGDYYSNEALSEFNRYAKKQKSQEDNANSDDQGPKSPYRLKREAIESYLTYHTSTVVLFDIAQVLLTCAEKMAPADSDDRKEIRKIVSITRNKLKDKSLSYKFYTEEQKAEISGAVSGTEQSEINDMIMLAFRILYYIASLDKYEFMPEACHTILRLTTPVKRRDGTCTEPLVQYDNDQIRCRLQKRMEEKEKLGINLNSLVSEVNGMVNGLVIPEKSAAPLAYPGKNPPAGGRTLSREEYADLEKNVLFLRRYFPVQDYNWLRLRYVKYKAKDWGEKDGEYRIKKEIEKLKDVEKRIPQASDYKLYVRDFRKKLEAESNEKIDPEVSVLRCKCEKEPHTNDYCILLFPQINNLYAYWTAMAKGIITECEISCNYRINVRFVKKPEAATTVDESGTYVVSVTGETLDMLADLALKSIMDISTEDTGYMIAFENGNRIKLVFEK